MAGMKLFVVAMLAVFVAASAANNATLFGVLDFDTNSQKHESATYVVTINPTTGAISQLVETLETTNSIVATGVSAFDKLNGVYYYVANDYTDVIYRANVKTKALLPPIFLDFERIYDITYDSRHQRMLIAGSQPGGDQLYSYSVGKKSPLLVSAQINADNSFASATLDEVNQIYYWIGYNATDDSTTLNSIYLADPSTITTNVVNCGSVTLTPYSLKYDSNLQQLFYLGVTFDLSSFTYTYYVATLTTQGVCSVTRTQLPSGVTLDYTYDSTTQLLWATFDDFSQRFIISIDLSTGKIVNSLDIGAMLPESLQIVYM